ncbi:MAG: MFS transporter [Chloroflexi bacterium]|nr:MAG: MFS transporter [Chloroflexota bacterium]TME57689.1 MAG: MFS transporter [Chloroflexota bacterium]
MDRPKPASIFACSVGLAGLGLLVTTTLAQAPHDLKGSGSTHLLTRLAILLVLTFLSSLAPLRTRHGAVLTVGLAPLFGALLLLPPWALMLVATFGTVDERVPGRTVSWTRFLFARGMFAFVYGLPSLALYAFGLQHPQAGWVIALPLAVVAIVALNDAIVAAYLSLLQGANFWRLAKNAVAGSWLTYVALPIVGYLIFTILQATSIAGQLVVFLLYGPLLVYRTSLQKQNRLDQWLRDSFIMQSRVVDKRDGQTFGHSQRVGEMSEAVARLLHLSDEMCNTIRVGGILHDLGKIAIPDSILLKPGKLTPEEYEIIKTHPTEGAQILAEHPEQKDVSEIVMHHHERWDGAGYPEGLKGDEIPIGSRIVNACDAFDTITQARVFRPTVKTPAEAIHELRTLAGTWYDPAVIGAMETIVAERWSVDIPYQAPATPKPGYRDVLAIPQFRRLWIGQGVSYFGDMMNTTGLAIMLFVVTRSPVMVALGLIAKAVPTIMFGLLAGPLVDRFNRQRVMVLADLARALLTVTIPFWALNWLPGVFIAVFLIAIASTFFNPAKQAIIPNLVPERLLVRANSLVQSSERTMELVGYALAGVLAATISWVPLFLIDAATYLFSAATLLGVPDSIRSARQKQVTLSRDIADGMRFIVRSPVLRSIMALTAMTGLFAGMTFPTLVVLAYGALHAGASGYGVLEAVIGGGAILGAMASPQLMARYRAGVLILIGVAGFGLSYALTGLLQSFLFAFVFLFACGVASTIYYVPLISITQREAPDYIRGRVMASRFLLAQAGLLGGMAISGPLTARLGAPLVFVTAGTLLVAAAIVAFAFRDLRDARLRDATPAASLEAVSG